MEHDGVDMSFSRTVWPRTQTLAATVIVALLATAPAGSQETPAPPLTRTSLTATIGTDADARDIFSLVFGHMFQPGSPRQEFLLSSQLRPEWLPVIDRVDLVLLTEPEAATLIAACGRYWVVGPIKRVGDLVSLSLGQRCGGTLQEYVVSFDGRAWRLGPPGTGENGRGWGPGIGSGFVQRPPGCPCL